MQYPDYYAALGVSKDASADDIKKEYRKLARKYHPDVSKEPDAAARMSQINEANNVLSDAEKRKVYDQVGHQAWAAGARRAEDVRPPPGWSGGFGRSAGHGGAGSDAHGGTHGGAGFEHQQGFGENFSDFYEELFGRAARERARRSSSSSNSNGQQRAWRGEDQHAAIELSLADAYRGAERAIRLEAFKFDDAGNARPETRTLNVKIPAGVAEGQLIRLSGQGHPGIGGGVAGDLLLEVHIAQSAGVQINGRDVTLQVPVAPWEAALGAAINVHTPAGALTVSVPAGSVSGRKLRVRGKGIPGAAPGDLYLELAIAVPSAVTDAQKAAWEALAKAYPNFDPRPR